jgi:hypothetical protein
MAITKIQSESLNLSDNYDFTGTVTGAGESNKPAFFASVGSSFSVANNTLTKVQFSNEIIDSDSCYDPTTNYRFTPNVAGKYYIFLQGRFETATDFIYLEYIIRKNNSSNISANNHANIHFDTISLSCLVDMNGSTDYIEAFCFQESGSSVNVTAVDANRFGGYLIYT